MNLILSPERSDWPRVSSPNHVSVASNFDRRVHSTIYAVLIKPSFRLFDVITDPLDPEKMRCFLREYQQEYAAHVREDRELAGTAARNVVTDSVAQ